MEKYLEQILCLESENIYHVYLLPSSGNGFWDVYEQSAVNLQHLVPGLGGEGGFRGVRFVAPSCSSHRGACS